MFTKQHYEAIAKVISEFGWEIHKDDLVEAFIAAFTQPRFKDNKFRKACGIEERTC